MENNEKINEIPLSIEKAKQLSEDINTFRDSIYENSQDVNNLFNKFMQSVKETVKGEKPQLKEKSRRR